MRATLILSSAIKPSLNSPGLRHTNHELRLKETLICLKKWQRIAKTNNLDCILVDNTYSELELKSKIPNSLFPNLQLLSAPAVSKLELRRGAGYAELRSLQFITSILNLNSDSLIIKCNARYYIRNFQNLFSFVDNYNKIYFYTNLRVDRVETKFFISTFEHLKNFLEFAEDKVGLQPNTHLENLLAKYINLYAFNESIALPIEPVIFGTSGHTGQKYRIINEAWAHNKINLIFKKLR